MAEPNVIKNYKALPNPKKEIRKRKLGFGMHLLQFQKKIPEILMTLTRETRNAIFEYGNRLCQNKNWVKIC